jgi:hypothetical protein
MVEVALIVLTVGLTLLGERLVNAPRDIRRNNGRIVNRDEDLATWIEDEAKALRRETIKVNIQKRPQRYAYLGEFETKQLRHQLLRRYRDQLRDAERVMRDVRASEQLPHRVLRRLRGQPIPELASPVDHAETIERWVTPPKQAARINFEKLVGNFGKLGERSVAQPRGQHTTGLVIRP